MHERIDLIKMISRRSWSRCGLWFSGVYLLATGASGTMALTSHIDSKSQFVLLQLPIALQLAASGAMGLYPVIDNLPAVVVYGSMIAIGTLCFYVAGLVAGSLARMLCLILNRSTHPTAVAAELGRLGEQAGEFR